VTQPLLTSRAISSTVRTKYKYKRFLTTFIRQKTMVEHNISTRN